MKNGPHYTCVKLTIGQIYLTPTDILAVYDFNVSMEITEQSKKKFGMESKRLEILNQECVN